MQLRVTITGPLVDTAASLRVVEAELRQAHTDALALIRTEANRGVNRYLGTYDAGWQPVRHEHGARGSLVSTMDNTAPHAAVQEEGREAGSRPPADPFIAWAIFRGIRPASGTTHDDYLGWALGVTAKHEAEGWRLQNPPAPVAKAIERTAARVAAIFDLAGARIARRLG